MNKQLHQLPHQVTLYKLIIVSIILCDCGTWTLHADTERWIQTFEHKCLQKLLRIS
ncbi:hypothetical protein DPMN_147998 [Dreissena polymorpha]|uniref:Uncharacterized protein n=1 Tax=Dreissena polymorpha TaxID=45954 RepID=A0A9D4J148_DREPO|nr:hypothetical protein DPMN_147998 [Dreissena polymorpha]